MPQTRLHWFWRAAIAAIVSCTYAALSVTVLWAVHDSVMNTIRELLGNGPGTWASGVGISIGWFLPVVSIAFVVYGLLTGYLGPRATSDGETRCRKCGYILRGITEPRCPECGERI